MSFFTYFFDKSPYLKGKMSENDVTAKLTTRLILNSGGKTLNNLLVPKRSGGTSEIDIVHITRKGIFVFENKNYAGYIFGSENNKEWTVTLYAGKSRFGGRRVIKHHFYNPIRQNKTHIKSLLEYLKSDVRIFSFITFSDRGELKDVTVYSPNIYICNHRDLLRNMGYIWDCNPDVLTDEQINGIYNTLLPLTYAAPETRTAHEIRVRNIKNNLVCPACGGNLVIRQVKDGYNKGRQFYGCSNYPKCRYTKNIK